MVPAAVWSAERGDDIALDSGGLRVVAACGVLAANFALFLLPPLVGALTLMGLIG
jgi:hypothetical protein